MKVKKIWIVAFLLPTLLLFAAIYLVPLIITFVTSFSAWNGFDPKKFIGLENYRELFFEDETFKSALVNSILWSVLAAFVHVPFGVMVALILFKKPFGWKFVRSVFMIPNIISTSALAVLYVFIFNPGLGMLNGFIRALGFTNFEMNWFFDSRTAFFSVSTTWLFFAGVIVLITLAELSAIPPSLHEAAKIDGATNLQVDIFINLPLLRNIIGTGTIIAVSSVLKTFETIYLTTVGGPGSSTTNLALMIYNEVTTHYRYGYANAIGIIQIILGIMMILIIVKTFRMGRNTYE